VSSSGLGLEIGPDRLLAVALPPRTTRGQVGGVGLATTAGSIAITDQDPIQLVEQIDRAESPRWVWWGGETTATLARADVSIDRCWDVLTVHRLLHGGWRTSAGLAWAWLHDLDPATLPATGQLDFAGAAVDSAATNAAADPDGPIRPDGHLRPDWPDGGWHKSPERLAVWAELALTAATLQQARLDQRPDPRRARSTAHAESVAEMLCAELARGGLPVDEEEATRIITESAGPRPVDYAAEEAERGRRDAQVLQHLDRPQPVNLRNPAEVKAMLNRAGLDLPDTRAWRLEKLRDTSPLVDALLVWRKAERIATTYGWSWLDQHVTDGRLRGDWSSSDGAAGRMTASAGLHNLPAPMRPAVAADPGHCFVRADLGQIEPRVLAAVSGDRALIDATAEADLYQPVAERLGVERDIAKVAVLGAMYGATTGQSAGALRGLEQNYPVAMETLERAAEQGKRGEDVLTIGGRRVRMGGGSASGSSRAPGGNPRPGDQTATAQPATEPDPPPGPSAAGDNLDRAISAAAARGRYARNALIQGSAAEFFKVWAIIVRRNGRDLGARVVLCLHDELLVHAPTEHADAAAEVVTKAVDEAAYYWSPEPDVRFVADVSIIQRWSEAKG
jgi:DNA polymerase-1